MPAGQACRALGELQRRFSAAATLPGADPRLPVLSRSAAAGPGRKADSTSCQTGKWGCLFGTRRHGGGPTKVVRAGQ